MNYFYDYFHNSDLIIEEYEKSNKDSSTGDVFQEQRSSPKTTVLMKSPFFEHFATRNVDRTRKLDLNGRDFFLRTGKRLGDSNIGDLLIFLSQNEDVVELNLAFNEIRCEGFIAIIDHVINYERIVKLDVQSNNIGSKGIKHFCEVGAKLRLHTLRLNGNKFGVQSSMEIALMLLNNRWLRELNVAEVDQTASSLVYFTTILRNDQEFHNSTLKILDISRPNPGCKYYFDSAHFSNLVGSMLKNNNSLEELHLRKFGFSCHDIELMLIEGSLNKSLLLLNLSDNNVGDFGAELLAKWLSRKPSLSSLLLAHNIISANGARALSRGMPFSKIKNLDISFNRINDSGITEILHTLKKSPCIKELRIFGNCIDRGTAKIINRMLLSGVLKQENLDVKPYRVDHEWHCARY